MATKQPFNLSGLPSRFVFSLLVVFATYNPSGYSFYHWLIDVNSALISLKIFTSLLVIILYYAMFRVLYAAFRLSGLVAASLAALLFSFLLITHSLSQGSGSEWSFYFLLAQYVVLFSLAIVLAFGLSWSHLIQRLTGQQQKRYVR
ncbi:MAG: hypothetical protein EXQ85_08720 [Alphaproteobacteria bacterium]|nr:hypothetical protein [Alphaproteobacteria bacterium]